MTTTFTDNLDLALMGTGDQVDNWGVVLNSAVITALDSAAGKVTSYAAGGSDIVVSLSEWQCLVFKVTGVLSTNISLIFPLSANDSGGTLAVGGARIIDNQTTGNFTITVKTAASGSTGVTAPQGYRSVVYSDTANVNFVQNITPLQVVEASVASATISSDQNDYAIASTVAYARLNVTTNVNVTGITNGAAGRILKLYNIGTGTLRLPGNSASSSAINRILTQTPVIIRPGAGAALQYDGTSTGWRPQNLLQSDPPAGVRAALSIKVTGNTTATVAANNVTMTDGTYFLQSGALNAPLNLSNTGVVNGLDVPSITANQTYYVFAISNGVTSGSLASLSATAPTLPSGYTFFGRIGALRTAVGVAQLMGTYQYDDVVQYVVGVAQTAVLPLIASSTSGSIVGPTPTWTAFPVTTFVPATASQIRLILACPNNGGNPGGAMAAPNNGYGPYTSATNSPPLVNASSFATGATTYALRGDFVLESTNIYYASNAAAGALYCFGWVDNL